MNMVRLGKTEIQVSKMGLEPSLSRELPRQKQCICFKRHFYHGINYFDTARAYSDSEENWGSVSLCERKIDYQYKNSSAGCKRFLG